MAPTTNFPIVEQPELLISSSFQSNPTKRKRESGYDATWPGGNILDTRHMEHAGPSVPQCELNGQSDETRRENTGSDKPSAVTSPNVATENESKKSQGGALWHDDPALSGKPLRKSTLFPAANPGDALPDSISLDILKQTIEYEFSLELLLKHRELRLIDQEIAKCQIALEQLRRCQVIPYPAMSSELEDIQAVASGSGPALENTVPHPSPWGIMEGPYSRHYARWLLPDSAFDPDIVDSNQFQAGKVGLERTTRGSVSERSHGMASGRTHRGSSNSRLQALSNGYPEPREEKGPLILRRSADGRMVKLVCTDCRRDNFNSAQGFINHCRIAHGRGYASHEAAALACGVEVENNNSNSNGVMESPAATSAKTGLVHPLIRSPTKAPSVPWNLLYSSSQRKDLAAPQREVGGSVESPIIAAEASSTPRTPWLSGSSHRTASSPFIPSPQTPHLSAFFAKIGHGGNLNRMVDQAKTLIDTVQLDQSSEDDDDDDDDDEDLSQIPIGPQSRSTRGVIGGAGLSRRPGTRPAPLERTPINKSIPISRRFNPSSNTFPSITYDSLYADAPASLPTSQRDQIDTPMIDTPATLNLSPNTIESQPAPSLISDDDGDEYENTHSESDSPSSAEEDGDGDRFLDFGVEHHGEEMDDLGNDSPNLGLATNVKPHSPSARRSSALRSPTAIRADPAVRHERHVSFASPIGRSQENLPKPQRRKGGN